MDYVHGLTIGQASGVIAVGVFVISCSAPLLICVLLLRWHGKELSAATWSVIDRQLQSTLWPTLFNSDSVATRHVDLWITCLVYLRTLLSILIVLAGVITPLGLGDTVIAIGARDVAFEYLPDVSPFGRNMQARSNLPMSRSCISSSYQCPGAFVVEAQKEINWNSLYPNYTGLGTTNLPDNMTRMFSSATDGTTVAGFFDIQYRHWKRANDSFYNHNEPFLHGVPRAVDNLILKENLTAVEGLIVDMQSGGIGLRNHTVPVEANDQGADWQEDILWLTPDFACANLNMSLQGKVAIKKRDSDQFASLNLVDDGAFANLQAGSPYIDWPVINRTQPDLGMRVRRSARLHNTVVAMSLNLTSPKLINSTLNTSIGRSWPLDPATAGAVATNPFAIGTQRLYSEKDMLGMPFVLLNSSTDTLSVSNSTLNKTVSYSPARDYPYLFSSILFSEIEGRCNGHYDDFTLRRDYNVECFLFHESPIRIDGGSPLEHEAGSEWKIPVHMCASAVKATIKTVTLSRNKTSNLSGLIVKNVSDKLYRSAQDYPIWAVEDWNRNESFGAGLAPIWGLVANTYLGTPGYNFTQSPEFYLPFSNPLTTWTGYITGPLDSLAGAAAPYGVMTQVFTAAFSEDYSSVRTLARYSGMDSAALSEKWQDLSKTDHGIEKILKLVWTNIMTGVVTSSRGRTSSAFSAAESISSNRALQTDKATIYRRRITYDWRYGAPALILLTLWLGLWVVSLLFALLCRLRPSHMKHMLRDTSLGRLAARQADVSTARFTRVSTNQWLRGAGHVKIPLGHSRTSSTTTLNKNASDDLGSYELTRIEEIPKTDSVSQDHKETSASKKVASTSSVSSSTYRLLDSETAYNR